MKRKLLLSLLIVLLTGCSKIDGINKESSKNITKESTVVSTTSTIGEPYINIDTEQYSEIIENYSMFIENTDTPQSDINSMASLANQDFYSGIYHATFDIDNNGVEELLIALKNQEGTYTLLDLYTISAENKLIRLTTEENQLSDIGERMLLLPLKEGKLLYVGSSSAFKQVYKVYEFDKKGTQLSKILEQTNEEGEPNNLAEPIDLTELNWQRIQADRPTEQKTSEGMDIAAIKSGDFSSITHSWANNAGEIISISENIVTFSSGDTGEIYLDGIKEENQQLVVGINIGNTGARVVFAPKGVSFSELFVSGETDTSRDRIVIGQASSSADEVYYPLSQ